MSPLFQANSNLNICNRIYSSNWCSFDLSTFELYTKLIFTVDIEYWWHAFCLLLLHISWFFLLFYFFLDCMLLLHGLLHILFAMVSLSSWICLGHQNTDEQVCEIYDFYCNEYSCFSSWWWDFFLLCNAGTCRAAIISFFFVLLWIFTNIDIFQLRVYLRTHALDQMVQATNSTAGLRTIKRVDQTLQDLGVCFPVSRFSSCYSTVISSNNIQWKIACFLGFYIISVLSFNYFMKILW